MTLTYDFMPTEFDVLEARGREARLKIPDDIRHRIAWFWKPIKGRYELRVMDRGFWVVVSR